EQPAVALEVPGHRAGGHDPAAGRGATLDGGTDRRTAESSPERRAVRVARVRRSGHGDGGRADRRRLRPRPSHHPDDLDEPAVRRMWTSRPWVAVRRKPDGPVPPFLLSPGDINKHIWNRVWGILHYQGRKRPSVQGEKGSHALVAAALPVVRGFCTDIEA